MTVETIDQSPTLAERSYRECNVIQLWSWNVLALLAVYNTFQCYLTGVEFTVQADHKCLQ